MVNRFLIVPLLFVLSGVPAASVICDLILCPEPTEQAASAGCHDHAVPPTGERMAARTNECTHIVPIDPYVASGSRFVLQTVTSAPVASTIHVPLIARVDADVRLTHAPPSSSGLPAPLPLRI